MNTDDAINFLEQKIKAPESGLPEAVFEFITRITPVVNVDLLIKDEIGRTLLSWRDDTLHGKGWHIPGGIVRFREHLEERIKKVAELEIGAEVKFEISPIAVNQIINYERDIRGHFISILYKCFLSSEFVPQNQNMSSRDNGFLKWHKTCPQNLIKVHEIYRKYI